MVPHTLHRKEKGREKAKAEGEEVAIGGWRTSDAKSSKDAVWFSTRLNRRNAPWAFARGEAFRTIASLELLGVLVGVMALLPEDASSEQLGLASFTCGTDNQGNMFLLDKLLTTKYPLGVVLMELSCQLGLRRAAMRANWIPRLQNEEADALTNSDFRHFSKDKEIHVDLDKLPFKIMNELFAEGEDYLKELADLKVKDAEVKAPSSTPQKKARKKAADSLRETQPW